MGKTQVALRQLYVSRGCSVFENQEIRCTFAIADFEVQIYIGKKPHLPIVSQTRKVIPYDPTKDMAFPIGTMSIQYAEKTDYAGIYLRK